MGNGAAACGQGFSLQRVSTARPREDSHPSLLEGQRKHPHGMGLSPPPQCPQYFNYVFPEGVDSVIVKVASNTAFPCSVISIQDVLVSQRPFHAPPVARLLKRGGGARDPVHPPLPSSPCSVLCMTWTTT